MVFVVCDLLLLVPIIVQLVAGDMRLGVSTAVVADVGQIVVRNEGEDDEGGQQDKNQFDWRVALAPTPARSRWCHRKHLATGEEDGSNPQTSRL